VARSGGGSDLSSSESEFLHKTNSKEGREWMRQWIMRLPTYFIGQRREGKRYRGGETVDGEWSSSMLPFWGERGRGITRFKKRKEHVRRLLFPTWRGDRRVQQCSSGQNPESGGI
jgi:hypothetical protein